MVGVVQMTIVERDEWGDLKRMESVRMSDSEWPENERAKIRNAVDAFKMGKALLMENFEGLVHEAVRSRRVRWGS